MILRRGLFTILRLNYIVNQATLIKVKDRCAKFTSRLPSLISPKHLKIWSKLSQKFGQSIRSPPQYRSLRDVPGLVICFQVDECRCFLSSNNVWCNIRCEYFDCPLCLFYFGSEFANGLEFANVLDLSTFT